MSLGKVRIKGYPFLCRLHRELACAKSIQTESILVKRNQRNMASQVMHVEPRTPTSVLRRKRGQHGRAVMDEHYASGDKKWIHHSVAASCGTYVISISNPLRFVPARHTYWLHFGCRLPGRIPIFVF